MADGNVSGADYLGRVIDGEVAHLLQLLPALSIEGPKAVGKTRSATRLAETVHRLDDPGYQPIIAADPTLVITGQPPVLVDEWQRAPETWDLVRRAVDDDPRPGRFLLTGSATPSSSTHSGAGRIVTVRMRPLSLAERAIEEPTISLTELLSRSRPSIAGETSIDLRAYVDEILSSGFPGIRSLLPAARSPALDGYVDRIVEHDFSELGHVVRRPAALRRWLQALAAASASTASYEKIRDAATGGHDEKPARQTISGYQDVLERLWIADPLPAWVPGRNQFSRLVGRPKHHLADPALAARLIGASAEHLLANGPLLGALFESLVTLSVRVYAQAAGASVHHLRDRDGRHEVDLILEQPDRRTLAMEVKLSARVADEDVRHLHWLGERLGSDLVDSAVITTGTRAYRRRDGIAVIPAALLGP